MKRLEERGEGVESLALKTFLWVTRSKRLLQMDELRDLLLVEKLDKDFNPNDRVEPQDLIHFCELLVKFLEAYNHPAVPGAAIFTILL